MIFIWYLLDITIVVRRAQQRFLVRLRSSATLYTVYVLRYYFSIFLKCIKIVFDNNELGLGLCRNSNA